MRLSSISLKAMIGSLLSPSALADTSPGLPYEPMKATDVHPRPTPALAFRWHIQRGRGGGADTPK